MDPADEHIPDPSQRRIPRGLLQKFPPATEAVPAGLILRISELDDAGLWGLLDAFRMANIDVLDVRQELCIDP